MPIRSAASIIAAARILEPYGADPLAIALAASIIAAAVEKDEREQMQTRQQKVVQLRAKP